MDSAHGLPRPPRPRLPAQTLVPRALRTSHTRRHVQPVYRGIKLIMGLAVMLLNVSFSTQNHVSSNKTSVSRFELDCYIISFTYILLKAFT